MRNARILAVGVAVALTVGGVVAFSLRDRLLPPPGPPELRCPPVIDLGNQPGGSVATGTLVVTNTGGRELVIDHIRTACGCAGLERPVDDGGGRIESLTVPPGAEAEVTVRLAVSGPVGDPFTTTIYFSTNDPRFPEYAVRAVVPAVTGGLRASPRSVSFGSVPVGIPVEQFVDLYDYTVSPRAVKSVTASPADGLSAELLPPEPRSADAEVWAGVPVARIRVRLTSDVPGPVSGKLFVTLDGTPVEPDVIPVSARLIGRVEVTPASLLLPLTTGEGQQVYKGLCICSAGGKPFTLTVEECPAGLTVTVSEGPDGAGKRVTVELQPGAIPAGASATRTVRLRAGLDSESIPVDIPVLCRGVDP